MKRPTAHRIFVLLLLAGLIGVSRPVLAQGRLAIGVAAGPSPYDLSGTGTGTAGAVLLPWRPVRGLVVEPAVAVFSYKDQIDERTTMLLPELSIQGELHLGQFRPFIGGGAGGSFRVNGNAEKTAGTLHVVGGARFDLSDTWGLTGQLRLRAVHPWTGETADVLFGVSRRLSGGT